MGTSVEFNDTLKLKQGSGFPEEPIKLGGHYDFTISGQRVYNLYPSRVYLVEQIGDKWNYIGHAVIKKLIIDPVENETQGVFEVKKIYPDEYREYANEIESPEGKAYHL